MSLKLDQVVELSEKTFWQVCEVGSLDLEIFLEPPVFQ